MEKIVSTARCASTTILFSATAAHVVWLCAFHCEDWRVIVQRRHLKDAVGDIYIKKNYVKKRERRKEEVALGDYAKNQLLPDPCVLPHRLNPLQHSPPALLSRNEQLQRIAAEAQLF